MCLISSVVTSAIYPNQGELGRVLINPINHTGYPLCPWERTWAVRPSMSDKCQKATSWVVLFLFGLIRRIDKNCLRRSLKLKLNDRFLVQGPYEMRLSGGY